MMTDWTCFTSFNRRLYDIIAAEMLASWLHHWPQDAKIVIYLEDDIDLPSDPRIEIRDWESCCGGMYRSVAEKNIDFPAWQSNHTQRYTKKGLAFVHILGQKPGRVCWLDADLLTIRSIPGDILDRAHDGGSVISLFDVSRPQPDGQQAWAAESGFVMIDTDHARFHDFYDRYRSYYDDPRMPEHALYYWDGEILIHAARLSNCGMVDLRSQCKGKSSTPLHVHWLGQYFRHMKSKRKKHYTLESYRRFWRDGVDINLADTKFPWQQ